MDEREREGGGGEWKRERGRKGTSMVAVKKI